MDVDLEKYEGQSKELMKLLKSGGKPIKRKFNGYATQVDKDTEITYTDYNGHELTMTVPKGSYVTLEEDHFEPKIMTEEYFNEKFCFAEKTGKPGGIKIGLTSMMD